MIVRQINVILQYDRKLEHVKLKKIANIHHKQFEMLGKKKTPSYLNSMSFKCD